VRVVLIGPSLEQRGGVATVMKGLKSYLLLHDVKVVTIASTDDGNAVHKLFVYLNAWYHLFSICALRKADIIHINMASRSSCIRKSLLALTCIFFGVPYIIHLHGGAFQKYYTEEIDPLIRNMILFVFKGAARIIALSKYWQSWLENELGITKVSTVFNGVASYDLDEVNRDCPTVLFLGQLGVNKGTDVLISAIRQVINKIPSTILELGGDGDLSIYRKQAFDLPNVRFLGWLDDIGKNAALSRATIYCLPSKNEGLPMSILEAMSAGLPVISTPVGGIPEVVDDQVTGILIPPDDVQALSDAIYYLLSNISVAKIMGSKGKSRQRKYFSSEYMGGTILNIYQSCIKNISIAI